MQKHHLSATFSNADSLYTDNCLSANTLINKKAENVEVEEGQEGSALTKPLDVWFHSGYSPRSHRGLVLQWFNDFSPVITENRRPASSQRSYSATGEWLLSKMQILNSITISVFVCTYSDAW